MPAKKPREFTVTKFINPNGALSWRVNGWTPLGERVRKNFPPHKRDVALALRYELEKSYLGGCAPQECLRPTFLSQEQIVMAECAFRKLSDTGDLLRAVDLWLQTRTVKEPAPLLDDAIAAFNVWLEATPSLRTITKQGHRSRNLKWSGLLGNVALDRITPESFQEMLIKRWSDPVTQSAYQRSASRFFAWCMEIPRKWITTNPASADFVKLETKERGVPHIWTLRQVARVLVAAREYRDGVWLRYIVLQLFCGLRPHEAFRCSRVNLKDREIHLDSKQTKANGARTVQIDEIAVAWLRRCPASGINRQSTNQDWLAFKKLARVGKWPVDVLRHTCLSHHFRRCGQYGLTAEFAGNSEKIIRAHYQGRVTNEETAQFWTWHPERKARLVLRAKAARWIKDRNFDSSVADVIPFKAAA